MRSLKDKKLCFEDYLSGLNYSEISEDRNIPRSTVALYVRVYSGISGRTEEFEKAKRSNIDKGKLLLSTVMLGKFKKKLTVSTKTKSKLLNWSKGND